MRAVHSPKTLTNRITLKYFEAGYTSMSADAIHQAISKNTRKAPVEDFEDFVKTADLSGVKVLKMSLEVNMPQTSDSNRYVGAMGICL